MTPSATRCVRPTAATSTHWLRAPACSSSRRRPAWTWTRPRRARACPRRPSSRHATTPRASRASSSRATSSSATSRLFACTTATFGTARSCGRITWSSAWMSWARTPRTSRLSATRATAAPRRNAGFPCVPASLSAVCTTPSLSDTTATARRTCTRSTCCACAPCSACSARTPGCFPRMPSTTTWRMSRRWTWAWRWTACSARWTLRASSATASTRRPSRSPT